MSFHREFCVKSSVPLVRMPRAPGPLSSDNLTRHVELLDCRPRGGISYQANVTLRQFHLCSPLNSWRASSSREGRCGVPGGLRQFRSYKNILSLSDRHISLSRTGRGSKQLEISLRSGEGEGPQVARARIRVLCHEFAAASCAVSSNHIAIIAHVRTSKCGRHLSACMLRPPRAPFDTPSPASLCCGRSSSAVGALKGPT